MKLEFSQQIFRTPLKYQI